MNLRFGDFQPPADSACCMDALKSLHFITASPDLTHISNKVIITYFLLPLMKLYCKYAQRIRILIVTNCIQTHKIVKEHPETNKRKEKQQFTKENLLTTFTGAWEPHFLISTCVGISGGLNQACYGRGSRRPFQFLMHSVRQFEQEEGVQNSVAKRQRKEKACENRTNQGPRTGVRTSGETNIPSGQPNFHRAGSRGGEKNI